MVKDCQDDVSERPIVVNGTHLKQLRQVGQLLERLPKDCSTTVGSHTRTGKGPDNRTLTYANYAGLVLLGVLHPAIESLRDLQRASELRRVRKALTPKNAPPAARTSMGSLSESVRVFDPELLQPIAVHSKKGRVGLAAAEELSPGQRAVERSADRSASESRCC